MPFIYLYVFLVLRPEVPLGSGSLGWETHETHWPAHVMMTIADILAPIWRQATIWLGIYHKLSLWHIYYFMHQRYRVAANKQIILEKGWEVGNTLASLLLTVSYSHHNNALYWQNIPHHPMPLTIYWLNYFEGTKRCFYDFSTMKHWTGGGSWNPVSRKTKAHLLMVTWRRK